MGKTGKALLDSARKRKVKVKEMWKKRVNKTRTLLNRLMGSREQQPLVGEAVVNDNNEGREVSHSALDSVIL